MNVSKKTLLSAAVSVVVSMQTAFAEVTVTQTSSYGLENVLYLLFLLFHVIVWTYVFMKTKPVKIDKKRLLSSMANAVTRVLCYTWFLVIFYMSKGIILISSSDDFLASKLFIFNILYFATMFFLTIFIVLYVIKHYSDSSGLTEFVKDFVWEVKNGE